MTDVVEQAVLKVFVIVVDGSRLVSVLTEVDSVFDGSTSVTDEVTVGAPVKTPSTRVLPKSTELETGP